MVIGIPTFESYKRTYQSSFHDNQGSLLVCAIPSQDQGHWMETRAPVLRLSESTAGPLKGLWTPPSGSLLDIRVGKQGIADKDSKQNPRHRSILCIEGGMRLFLSTMKPFQEKLSNASWLKSFDVSVHLRMLLSGGR